jgi:hypothetical protein
MATMEEIERAMARIEVDVRRRVTVDPSSGRTAGTGKPVGERNAMGWG